MTGRETEEVKKKPHEAKQQDNIPFVSPRTHRLRDPPHQEHEKAQSLRHNRKYKTRQGIFSNVLQ